MPANVVGYPKNTGKGHYGYTAQISAVLSVSTAILLWFRSRNSTRRSTMPTWEFWIGTLNRKRFSPKGGKICEIYCKNLKRHKIASKMVPTTPTKQGQAVSKGEQIQEAEYMVIRLGNKLHRHCGILKLYLPQGLNKKQYNDMRFYQWVPKVGKNWPIAQLVPHSHLNFGRESLSRHHKNHMVCGNFFTHTCMIAGITPAAKFAA